MSNAGWSRLSRILRETEREIAADPEEHETTAEEWERIRQWPGERRHVHIAERCWHGHTKRNLCDHQLEWSRWRVRSVPCDASFCPERPEEPGESAAEDGWG